METHLFIGDPSESVEVSAQSVITVSNLRLNLKNPPTAPPTNPSPQGVEFLAYPPSEWRKTNESCSG